MKGGKSVMMDRKKIFGLIGIVIATTISTVVSQWITDREIEEKVHETIAENQRVNGES